MIKNVVFDIGRVIVSFDPEQAIYDKLGDWNEAKRLVPIIFSKYWGSCDRGEITFEEQADLTVALSPSDEEFIRYFLATRIDMFHPLEETKKVIHDLSLAGVDMYYLSDTSFDVVEGLTQKLDYFSLLKGGVMSCAEKASKADDDLKIFKNFLERFDLDPSECVFIDDLERNINHAKQAGFNTIHLTDNTVIREKLRSFDEFKDIL